jgi:uncharacterized membrane protein
LAEAEEMAVAEGKAARIADAVSGAAAGFSRMGNKLKKSEHRSLLHAAFETGITLKAVDGLLEIAGGVLAWKVPPATVSRIVALLTQHELSKDPHDFLARHLIEYSRQFAHGGNIFAALYLVAHGVVKVGLVAALWRNKLWAYPAMAAVLALFIVYQVYRLSRVPTALLVALTVFDVIVLGLVWAEYRRAGNREKGTGK